MASSCEQLAVEDGFREASLERLSEELCKLCRGGAHFSQADARPGSSHKFCARSAANYFPEPSLSRWSVGGYDWRIDPTRGP